MSSSSRLSFASLKLWGFVHAEVVRRWSELANLAARGNLAVVGERELSRALGDHPPPPFDQRLPIVLSEDTAALALSSAADQRERTFAILLVGTRQSLGGCLPGIARAGIDDVFFLDGAGEVERFQEVVRAAAAVNSLTLPTQPPCIGSSSSVALYFGCWCARNSYRRHTVETAARALGLTRRALERILASENLPSPGRLIRESLAARASALKDVGLSSSVIADLLGYPTSVALARMLRRPRGRRGSSS